MEDDLLKKILLVFLEHPSTRMKLVKFVLKELNIMEKEIIENYTYQRK